MVEFIELYVILANVPVFGGLNLPQAALVFALANAGFALADLVFGQLDTMPTYLRLGRLEVMLVRPMPLMLQLITSDFQLRRLGRRRDQRGDHHCRAAWLCTWTTRRQRSTCW